MAKPSSRVRYCLYQSSFWNSCRLGDALDILELRHDWAKFNLTPENFKYVLTRLIPDVIFHTQAQDEEQIRDNYDRTTFCGILARVFRLTNVQRLQVVTIFTNGSLALAWFILPGLF